MELAEHWQGPHGPECVDMPMWSPESCHTCELAKQIYHVVQDAIGAYKKAAEE